MARMPASIPDLVAQFGPHLNREPAGGWTTLGEPDRIVPDALLLLRPAVRHPAQGEEREDRRLRTLGGIPLQQREALPQGREALHAGRAPGSAADAARSRRSARLPADRLGRPRSTAPHARSGASSPRYGPDAFAVLDRRFADQREGVPDGQVRTGGRAHREYRLQRPALHGVGGGRVEEDSRDRSQRQSVERHPEGESRFSSRARTSPSAPRSPPTISGRRARTAHSSSCSIRV